MKTISTGIGWEFGKMKGKEEHEKEMIAPDQKEELIADQK